MGRLHMFKAKCSNYTLLKLMVGDKVFKEIQDNFDPNNVFNVRNCQSFKELCEKEENVEFVLNRAFVWGDSPQGREYWFDIYDNVIHPALREEDNSWLHRLTLRQHLLICFGERLVNKMDRIQKHYTGRTLISEFKHEYYGIYLEEPASRALVPMFSWVLADRNFSEDIRWEKLCGTFNGCWWYEYVQRVNGLTGITLNGKPTGGVFTTIGELKV